MLNPADPKHEFFLQPLDTSHSAPDDGEDGNAAHAAPVDEASRFMRPLRFRAASAGDRDRWVEALLAGCIMAQDIYDERDN